MKPPATTDYSRAPPKTKVKSRGETGPNENDEVAMPNGQIRPLDFGELLDQSFTLYRRHFALLYTISVVPGLLISPLAILLREPHGVVPTAANFGSYMLRLYGWLLVYSLGGFFSIAAAVYAVSQISLGRKTTVWRASASVGEFSRRPLNLWVSLL